MQPIPKVPGYELLRPLGGGPLTWVFSARDLASDESCAVKLLREEWTDDSTEVKLLQREARAGLTVRHPHLVRFLDAHVTRPPYFLVMELLPGGSLRRRLRKDYRLDLRTALWVIRQAAEALAALHRAGFIHADIKPDNIHLVDDGTAKLIDLGFAHRPGENAALREEGYILGTADYFAPELCALVEADAAPAGYHAPQSSDLFSLGVTLFETLAGRLPYPGGSTRQTLHRHRCDPPADIRQYVDPLPAAFVKLLNSLLAHRPGDRPRTGAVVQRLMDLEIATFRQRRSA
jgi:serine/threonine protein kinase